MNLFIDENIVAYVPILETMIYKLISKYDESKENILLPITCIYFPNLCWNVVNGSVTFSQVEPDK